MKTYWMRKGFVLGAALVLTAALSEQVRAGETNKVSRPPIYDESADGAKQIAAGLAAAKQEGKQVLLQFGANWCGWCHKLHQLFATDRDIAAELKQHYVVVLIDVNQEHNKAVDTKYGHPTRFGLPVIVILDADGNVRTTQDTGKLEAGNQHDPAKVLTFLKEWAQRKAP